ncbi:MAG: DUF2213 domain-containing protein [Desulfurellales bacterium]|nr:MAG: DUF2213 domain-containing protein [Desulfurellales bacterium]
MKRLNGFKAHVDGTLRQEVLDGNDYLVVPVVALVEGVIQGMTASGPELALAGEFAKFPTGWDGRPVVMNHPVDVNGLPVSANSPGTLKEYQIGTLFNSRLAGSKLITEAWVNITRAEELNSDSAEILKMLQSGDMIEVSTGYFADSEDASGVYNNKEYIAIQRNIVPDHLAFLSVGSIGACSNDAGCGAPRINHTLKTQDCGCGCNGTNDSCKGPVTMADKTQERKNPKAYSEPMNISVNTLRACYTLMANSIPDGMLDSDAVNLIENVLRKTQMYTYVIGITSNTVVYEQYNSNNYEYRTFQQGFSIDDAGKVALDGNVQEVMLMTKILPVANAEEPPNSNEEEPMTTETVNPSPAPENSQVANKTTTLSNDSGTLEVTMNAQGEPTNFAFTPANPQVNTQITFETLLANASPEIRESINVGLKLHATRKNELITNLKATERCKFDDAALHAMSIDMLEGLASLAQIPNYTGRALPAVNEASDDNRIPDAPKVFEFKPTQSAAAA